jgi:hypothetical protein
MAHSNAWNSLQIGVWEDSSSHVTRLWLRRPEFDSKHLQSFSRRYRIQTGCEPHPDYPWQDTFTYIHFTCVQFRLQKFQLHHFNNTYFAHKSFHLYCPLPNTILCIPFHLCCIGQNRIAALYMGQNCILAFYLKPMLYWTKLYPCILCRAKPGPGILPTPIRSYREKLHVQNPLRYTWSIPTYQCISLYAGVVFLRIAANIENA